MHIAVSYSLMLACSQQHQLNRHCNMKCEDITLDTNEVEQLATQESLIEQLQRQGGLLLCSSHFMNIHLS